MSEDLLQLRKSCLLAKLLSGKAEPKKIAAKAVETLFKSPKVVEHIPFDEAGVKLTIDELVRDGTITLEQKGKSTTYLANDRTVGGLGTLPKFPPPPPPQPIDPKMKAFVLLGLLAAGNPAGAKTVTPPAALGFPKGMTDRLFASLEEEGSIERANAGGLNEGDVSYRITERGKRRLVQLPQHSKAVFKVINGEAINSLIQFATNAAPAGDRRTTGVPDVPSTSRSNDDATKSTAALPDDTLINEAKDLLRERYGHTGLVPIFELRRSIRQKHGDRAASHEHLDPQLKRLRGGRLRLVSIGDRSKTTPDQLQDAVPGVEETFFYVRDLR